MKNKKVIIVVVAIIAIILVSLAIWFGIRKYKINQYTKADEYEVKSEKIASVKSVVGERKIKTYSKSNQGVQILKLTFIDTGSTQNYNKNKSFNGKIGLEEYKNNFNNDSWATIVANVKANNISKYNVGDTKEVDMGTYGTHTLRIANTSTPSECSTAGFSQTACGFVLEFADIITTHKMNDTATNVGGWPATSMRTFVNNDIYNAIPSELRNLIIDTATVSGHGSEDTENFTSTDKLYLLAPGEVWSDWKTISDAQYDTTKNLTRTLDYYTAQGVTTSNYSGAIKKNGTNAYIWCLRTPHSITYNSFFVVNYTGGWTLYSAHDTNGVSPAFRIG